MTKMDQNKDKYKYFRIEARELLEGLNHDVMQLGKGGPGKDLARRILRYAHTLKGASRVVKQPKIADLANSIEDLFSNYQDGSDVSGQERVTRALAMLDLIAAELANIDLPGGEPSENKPGPAMEELWPTVRVEIEEADSLLNGISEVSVRIAALRRDQTVGHARQMAANLLENLATGSKLKSNGAAPAVRSEQALVLAEELSSHLERLDRVLTSGFEQVEVELAQVSDAAGRLRLLPVSTVFATLERTVRDAAQALQKEVLFESFGGDNRLDMHVLAGLRDALLHVVRNAVAHGIETRAERLATGKPAQGRVELRVERRGSRTAFTCRDDGRGIDMEAVRNAAVRRGLVEHSEAASMGLEEAVRIIMKSGVSTSSAIDEFSGRGIGLDVVREITARLKGEVTLRSEPGRGISVEILVPISLSSLTALGVEAGGMIASLPLDAVHQVLRIADHEIARTTEQESIVYDGKVIPFLRLSRALRNDTGTDRKRQQWSAIVLKSASGGAAIGVDRLLGTTRLVMRPLPSFAESDPVIAGASLNTEGNPQLVLDPGGLMAAAYLRAEPVPETALARPASVLIIDDSLTTRMLEQSILESAGYEVDLATSGEEGLGKVREKAYSIFLVDVEMPGIDGFEFVSRMKADPLLHSVPSILITSRNSVEDRRRAEQSGARGYIVKGEFDQGHLLQTIRRLIG